VTDEATIWLGKDGKRYGPYAVSDIRAWLADGKLTDETLAWQVGMAGWMALSYVLAAPAQGTPLVPANDIRPNKPPAFPWQAAVLLSVVALVILRRRQKRRTPRSLG